MKTNDNSPLKAPDQLTDLFRSFTGHAPEQCIPLAQGGSERRYFRMVSSAGSYVGTVNPNVAENLAFRHYAQVFGQYGLPVPEVYAISRDKTCYLQEDLGDQSLYTLLLQEGGMKQAGQELTDRFRQALSHLAVFQLEAHKSIHYKKFAFSGLRFGKDAMLDDLRYFRYYFLRLHPQLRFNENRLLRDMVRFASLCASAPSDYFMYRDFQSRNIMISKGNNYYIDFQGGRRGALPYDVVSLLWQAMAGFTQTQREALISGYKDAVQALNPAAAEGFDNYLPLFVHLRQMQVLGAYGLRGLVQRKIHFIRSIPVAIRAAGENLRHYPLPEQLSELTAVLKSLESLYDLYPLPNEAANKQLTVEIFSFSYLNGGLPPDISGNGGGFVFDCRALPNPGREAQYRQLTGRDAEVTAFLEKSPEVHDFLDSTAKLIRLSVDDYLKRGFTNLSVGYGCTGGQHRSVYCAEKLTEMLKKQYPTVHFSLHHHHIQQ
ncbi:MAG TPA: RNase adapter RapZ [Bacteroidales bacterium]|nr:RNase adapter RapZ [Bacteroidales bacterium]